MGKESKKTSKRKSGDFFIVCKNIKYNWFLIVFASVTAIVQNIFVGKIPDLTGKLFDGNFDSARLIAVVGTILLSFVIGLAAYIIRVYAESISVRTARRTVWRRMMNVRTEYYDHHDPNSMLSMVTVEAQTMGAGLVQLFIYIPFMLALCLVSMLQLFTY